MSPNYDLHNETRVHEVINSLQLRRAQIYSASNMHEVKGSSIMKRTRFMGIYQLEIGKTNHNDLTY